MGLKLSLARGTHKLEKLVERIFPAKVDGKLRIDSYVGYATSEHLVVRGRVLTSAKSAEAVEGQSTWLNFRQMVALFATDEVADVTVSANDVIGRTDAEGYFTILLPRGDVVGQVSVEVSVEDFTTTTIVIVPSRNAERGVISDIDDTIMLTGAHSLARNLWTSLTGNMLTRHVFPDAIELLSVLQREENPAFFVSSSPWNFHSFLESVFARAGLPPAPKFLRDYGISDTQFITGTHGDHKGSAIDTILTAAPALKFVLIGDTGQHDAQVYLDAIKRHPDRIEHVILRAAGGIDVIDQGLISQISATGVPITADVDYTKAIKHFS